DAATLARKVLTDDGYVDDLVEQLFRERLSFMIEDTRTISRAIRLSFIAKYLERMADHATNIAELVVYLVEGKIIRHTTPPGSSGNRLAESQALPILQVAVDLSSSRRVSAMHQ